MRLLRLVHSEGDALPGAGITPTLLAVATTIVAQSDVVMRVTPLASIPRTWQAMKSRIYYLSGRTATAGVSQRLVAGFVVPCWSPIAERVQRHAVPLERNVMFSAGSAAMCARQLRERTFCSCGSTRTALIWGLVAWSIHSTNTGVPGGLQPKRPQLCSHSNSSASMGEDSEKITVAAI